MFEYQFLLMKKIVLVVALTVVVIAAAVFVKLHYFPSVKDAWFEMNRGHLLKVPAGLVVFRPTHFHDNIYRIIVAADYHHNGRDVEWFLGRDLPLRIAMAVAYKVNRAFVLLPPDAPKNHFDFLATTLGDPQVDLQSAIRHRLGLVGQSEMRDTPVLAIEVMDPSLGNLSVSDPSEKFGMALRKGKIYFRHAHIQGLIQPFEREMDMPLVDETGLTNAYNFSVPWNGEMRSQFMLEASSRGVIEKMLNAIGLTLRATNAPVQMLVVKHI